MNLSWRSIESSTPHFPFSSLCNFFSSLNLSLRDISHSVLVSPGFSCQDLSHQGERGMREKPSVNLALPGNTRCVWLGRYTHCHYSRGCIAAQEEGLKSQRDTEARRVSLLRLIVHQGRLLAHSQIRTTITPRDSKKLDDRSSLKYGTKIQR